MVALCVLRGLRLSPPNSGSSTCMERRPARTSTLSHGALWKVRCSSGRCSACCGRWKERVLRRSQQSSFPGLAAQVLPLIRLRDNLPWESDRVVLEAFTSGFMYHSSVCVGHEGAKKVVRRYRAAGYGFEFVWCKALKEYAITVKTEQDVTVPSRIVVDLRRSGANSSQFAPSASSCQFLGRDSGFAPAADTYRRRGNRRPRWRVGRDRSDLSELKALCLGSWLALVRFWTTVNSGRTLSGPGGRPSTPTLRALPGRRRGAMSKFGSECCGKGASYPLPGSFSCESGPGRAGGAHVRLPVLHVPLRWLRGVKNVAERYPMRATASSSCGARR